MSYQAPIPFPAAPQVKPSAAADECGTSESIVAERFTAGSSCCTSGANAAVSPSVGGGDPWNFPVARSINHGFVGSSGTLSSPTMLDTSCATGSVVPLLRGITGCVTRGDSSDVGPDLTEFTSNAVTV